MELPNVPRWATVIILILLGYLGSQFAGDVRTRLDSAIAKLESIALSVAVSSQTLADHGRRLDALERRGP